MIEVEETLQKILDHIDKNPSMASIQHIESLTKQALSQVKKCDLADVGERKPTYNDGLRDELTLLKEKRDAALGSNAIRYWEREIKRVKKKLYG